MCGAGRLSVEVLGPLRVRTAAGDDLTPAGPLQRRLLALLVLRRGAVVTVDAAVDALWPTTPPRDATAALQNQLSRLRRVLPEGAIASVAAGYRLDPLHVEVDADRLRDRLAAGGLDVAATAEVQAILRRWSGPAYPELADVHDALVETADLEELRVRAIEDVADAKLRAGDLDGLVAELRSLADREPLRERPRALVMSALARTGRVVEALRVYDDFRRLLGDELGIAPSPALDAQHAELLDAKPLPAGVRGGFLPVPPTPLLGRDQLVDELVALVPECRVITLVGPGGVGKTRLLVELGHRLRGGGTDAAVVLCELAQVDPASAVDHVASSLGIDPRPGSSTADRIARVVGDAGLVLLLDNCEHVVDAIAGLVEALSRACAGLHVVATSRERLRVAGEHVRPVPPLDTGAADSVAVGLFLARAHSARPGFDPDDVERAGVADIVRRLDGLPLAIELAAARLHTHDVKEIADGLDRPLALLAAGYRASSRHASLEAVASWSHDLLGPQLRDAFAALSVFSGPFTVRGAAAVCGVELRHAEDLLAQLVERSLVFRAADRRYSMLGTLRAFAVDRLAASSVAEEVARRHAAWMVEWAESTQARLADPHDVVLTEIDDAVPELRVALGWLIDRGLLNEADRLVASLVTYALLRLRPDVLAWAELVIAADPHRDGTSASHSWAAAAYAAWMAGDVAEAGRRSVRAVELSERDGGPSRLAATVRGNFDLFEGRLDDAIVWYRRAVRAAGDDVVERTIAAGAELLALGYAGDPSTHDVADSLLRDAATIGPAPAAYAWYCAGEAVLAHDAEEARARLQRALDLAEHANASFVRGVAGATKASIEARVGDPEVAAADYRWLIPHWQRAGMWSTQWTMLRSIVGLLDRLGRHHDAAVLEGAVRAPGAGHRIFGADAIALEEIGARLRAALGEEAYRDARRRGSVLDGQAAAEHALRSL